MDRVIQGFHMKERQLPRDCFVVNQLLLMYVEAATASMLGGWPLQVTGISTVSLFSWGSQHP